MDAAVPNLRLSAPIFPPLLQHDVSCRDTDAANCWTRNAQERPRCSQQEAQCPAEALTCWGGSSFLNPSESATLQSSGDSDVTS